jgi:preprotein translocase subunit SecY
MSGAELNRRIWFTLGALLVYRFGTYVPLPEIDPAIWNALYRSQSSGILGVFNAMSGGAAARLSVLALSITPFVSAAIIVQFATIFCTKLRSWRGRGERYAIVVAVLLAAFQGYGVSLGLESVNGLVVEPGWLFRLSTAATLTGGTLFLIWLSRQITLRGVGNGIALILFTGIVTEWPAATASMLERGREGLLPLNTILAVILLMIVVTAVVVFMERARRRLPVRYSASRVSAVEAHGHLSVKVNSAGLMPITIASSAVLIGLTGVFYVAYYFFDPNPEWWDAFKSFPTSLLYSVAYAVLFVAGAFFYAANVLDPDRIAADLARHGGRIEGIEPGEPTAAYLDHVLSRTTAIGAAYLALVCLIPEILIAVAKVPFYFGGASLLIVVCTVMDIQAQVMAKRS